MGSNSKQSFPFEIRKLNEAESSEAFKDVKGGHMKYFARVGPQGYFFSDPIVDLLPQIYNMELRPDDVFVASFPKSGTTWVQELVWMVANDCDYETAKTVPVIKRFTFLEYSAFVQSDIVKDRVRQVIEEDKSKMALLEVIDATAKANIILTSTANEPELVAKLPSPRFLKTHLPFSLLPHDILDKTKVVYVARDPRDVAVSYFHHYVMMPVLYGYKGEFKDFWELFKNNCVDWSPFFKNFREAWALKDHPNMLFLFYEELSKDLPAAIRRVAAFLGKSVTEEQVAGLCEHLKFDNFKKNKAVNYDSFKELGMIVKSENFIRKGKVGGWRDYFDEQMTKDAEQWMEEGLRGIDFKF